MKKNYELFYTNFNLFILLIIWLHGLSHGSQIDDQASRLMAFRLAKIRSPQTDEEWVATSLGIEGSFDVGKMEDDVIEDGLPGQPLGVVKFKQYGGYVNVDKLNGRSLFYYFVEAVQDPSSKPLILWLNGGPGCSSLGAGGMLEIGPFGVKPDGKTLYSRPFAWNKVANTLFLESPAGVGFSYSNSTSDYENSGDKRTAQDSYTFLVNWFKRYPHYKTRDFYIMGESYAGFYIPELADTIMKRNMEGGSTTRIQLKGIMIGNGVMNDDTDLKGFYDYVWSHALISDETHRGLMEQCIYMIGKNTSTQKCGTFLRRAATECGTIEFYNIYAPVCLASSFSSKKTKRLGGYDPCEQDYVHKYLNLPRVQEALHANRTKLPYTWNLCSSVIGWKDSPSTMFPIYKRLIAAGLRILLFSGDVDAVVPVTGTRYSINALNLKVIKPWHPWTDDTEEVAGYQVVYDGLTFATVRGAGHQVPQFRPRRALALVKMFLANLHQN